MAAIGAFFSGQVNRVKDVASQQQALARRLSASGQDFPGSGHRPADRKTWMAELGPERLRVHQVVWPGTHNSATAEIGVPFITRPFAQCQSLSVYDQLATGCRLLDVRVQKDRRVCHGPLVASYTVDVVIDDVRRFLAETVAEVLVLEVRTEFGHEDPPEFAKYLAERLGEHLIPQDDAVFRRTVAELLPRRVICVWKPRNSPAPARGGPLWSAGYLRDNWINTDLPEKKLDGNLASLGQQPDPAAARRHLYRVENTLTPQTDNPVLLVEPVTRRIHRFARFFIAQAFARGLGGKLQVLSTDFIDGDFVDACAGVTKARVDGAA
ncbi:uncharacterized protein LOC123397560 [Hordeum vulgare subsp. vulgare]|uniref:Phosphatidylinositol-specific phospholipase C X domain-containing protein n=1 Tax=Hordeum vulgare subsp. vulgare TaxID=112509 RepID=A0A8I6YKA4_HORVV|nr:uncharacterized protein LOC123397560 [Hordeum vulgare subsp. vulgare]